MIAALPLSLALVACSPSAPDQRAAGPAPLIAAGEIETRSDGRCFARTEGPTETRIVTALVEVEPAQKDRNGVVLRPPVFREVTRPVTRRVGEGAAFETLCPQQYTPQLVSSLQRALIVRRAFAGPVSGSYDGATRAAVQAFQRASDVDSPLLSVATARFLGLLAVPREAL